MTCDQKKLYFGLKKSAPTPIDRLVRICQEEKIELPNKFSLREKVKQVYDQMTLSSCSANAAANFLLLCDKVDCNISRLYLYFCTRYLDNNHMMPLEDRGATLANVFTSLKSYHWIEEVKYPYIVEKVNDVPSPEIFKEAIMINKSPIVSYRQILPSKYAIKYVLAHLKKPILFGMVVYPEFFQLTKDDDILKMPNPMSEMLGMHAVVIVGFSDETETLEILNSHGSTFANGGYFRMPYEYALNKDLCFEFYCVE